MNKLESTLALTGNGRLRRDTQLVFELLEKIRGGFKSEVQRRYDGSVSVP